MNILLVVVGIIFFASVFIAYNRGLIKIAASLLATIISIVLVFFISPHVSSWIQESTPLKEIVQEKCVEIIEGSGEATDISQEEQIFAIENAGLPAVFEDMLKVNNNSEVYEALGVTTFVDYIAAYIAKIIADIIAFLITFIVISIAVKIVVNMLGIIDKLPLLGGLNKLAGGVVGVGIGILIIWILFIVITLLYSTAFGKMCLEQIAESKILTQIYEGNLLMKYITKF